MSDMTSAEAKYQRTVEAAHAAAAAPELWPDVLSALADFVGGSGAMMACHDLPGDEHWLLVGNLCPEISRLYLDHYTDNVFAREMARRGPGLYAAHELTDMSVHRRTAFMADVWAPQGIETILQMAHPAMTTGGASGGFAVTLGAQDTEDLSEITRRWERIAPQLRLAADLYLARSERQRPAYMESQYLALLPEAALLVDAGGTIIAANAKAETLLEHGVGFRYRAKAKLQASDDADERQLRRALSAATVQGRLATTFRLREPQRLLAIVAPAPEIDNRVRLSGPSRALVRIVDVYANHRRRASTASQLFELSAAETEVLAHCTRGKAAPAIAGILGVSAATVRTHLKHIFDKTGIRSQAELAQLVARLPEG